MLIECFVLELVPLPRKEFVESYSIASLRGRGRPLERRGHPCYTVWDQGTPRVHVCRQDGYSKMILQHTPTRIMLLPHAV